MENAQVEQNTGVRGKYFRLFNDTQKISPPVFTHASSKSWQKFWDLYG